MTTESEQPGESARKFDAVASLFGSIVPPPGSTMRPVRQFRPKPLVLPEPSPTDIVPQPTEVPEPIAAEPDHMLPPVAELAPSPPPKQPNAPARPRPREIPWPDAFEPRPNYRKPEPRNWSWLLVIPLAALAALAFTVLDTRSLKLWIDIHVLHREPIVASMDSPLLPAPFRAVPSDPAAPTPATAAEVEPTPLETTPALPTSPVPVPPGTEVSPPPVDPTQAAVAAAAAPPIHVTIQYRRGIPGADGEARRLAALLQNTGGSVELHANAATVRAPMIMFYNAVDKHSAAGLATVLANEVASWTVRQGTGKFPPGNIDIWMP